jgi:hypothetical protein
VNARSLLSRKRVATISRSRDAFDRIALGTRARRAAPELRGPDRQHVLGFRGENTGPPREEPSKPLYRTSIAGLESHVGIA